MSAMKNSKRQTPDSQQRRLRLGPATCAVSGTHRWFGMKSWNLGVSAAAFAPLLLAGCAAGGSRAFTPNDWTEAGEIKIGRFTYTPVQTVYRALISKTWRDRRGDRLDDDFTRLAYPGTAPIEDWAMAELLVHFVDNDFFSLPQRLNVRKEDVMPADQTLAARNAGKLYLRQRSPNDRALRYSSDALIVETDRVRAAVLLNDCSNDAQIRAYAQCIKSFEALAKDNTPAIVGVSVESPRSFLGGFRRGRALEPTPTVEPTPLKLRAPLPEGGAPDAGAAAPPEKTGRPANKEKP